MVLMKNMVLLLCILFLCSWAEADAQGFHLQPTPQKYVGSEDSVFIPARYSLQVGATLRGSAAEQLLAGLFPDAAVTADFSVCIGMKGDKSVRKYAARIPKQAEGYYLKIDKEGIVVAGADRRGVFYGVQTLVQLIALPKLPLVEVTDYPDVPYRGVVEGFYGVPWSREARLSQLDFYGRNKMNIYIYGPKDDPYHSSPNWRKPYPAQEAEQLKELVECARRNEVLFYWAIHPGKDIRWNTEDRDLLMEKFESMYRLGIRAFAVFFDDISGEGTSAEKQVELLNDIYHNFVKVKGDVAPLLMCPTEYNRLWTKLEGGYLATLGGKLHPDIGILWTGDKVVACIDKPTMQFVNPLLKRKAFIWWNFPVSDYVRDRLLLGAVYGNGTDIDDDISAFISNPMEHAEASKIALFSIADYAWNMDAYKSDASWRRAVRYLMPGHAAALQVFASHNSDLGGNEHDFRREESEQIRPALERLLDAYCREGKREVAAASAVTEECERMIASADLLLASDENPALIKEITPWLMQFKLLGEYGREVLCMLAAQCDGKKTELEKAASHAKALQVLMKKIDATYNQNGFQPGVKTGSCHLKPAFDRLYQEVVQRTGK
ncbi:MULTISPECIES: beta-N-acetylhexosaminidase family protein [Bacteroides]|jgi:hyaluronoglucosaminidase|nr:MULTISPECIES: beta-N-acetylglucosaminidase domain-containing protein [Bacteroides]MBS6600363.1 beta-N-acetylglucosaminidase domain-containing protein [Clostridium sp.]MCM1666231.1 beta-N-acetylglucosaminidase domain-containing protein [Bacteroides uniformis]MCM1702387.1 beta-N-acetylglucosaminidase domain-containing protein [Bacteroides uniformis]MCM1840418.1 beta-N-acetylglucosaminidase domain-containing protein [Bacteroides uniformis]MCM1859361.1 beta-N-acetylglucosaminidase domain-contai